MTARPPAFSAALDGMLMWGASGISLSREAQRRAAFRVRCIEAIDASASPSALSRAIIREISLESNDRRSLGPMTRSTVLNAMRTLFAVPFESPDTISTSYRRRNSGHEV